MNCNNLPNYTKGKLYIAYHSASSVGLKSQDQEYISKMLTLDGLKVDFENFSSKKRGLPPASILEDTKLIIMVAGTIASTTILQEIVKDFYNFFKQQIKEYKSDKVDHFAIIIDICSNGEKIHVGIDFKDEQSLDIGFYRLHAYLSNTKESESLMNKLTELEYYKIPDLLSSCILVLSNVLFFLSLYLIYKVLDWAPKYFDLSYTTATFDITSFEVLYIKLNNTLDTTLYVLLIISCLLVLVSSSFVGIILIKLIESHIYKKFIREYKDEAKKWVLEVTTIPGAPRDASINIEIKDPSNAIIKYRNDIIK